MARKFFFICAGLFLIVGAYAWGTRSAVAQGSFPQQVAVLSGEVADGGTIPLPTYPDGTPATESECHWTVSMARWNLGGNSGAFIGRIECYTEGRVVRSHVCTQADCGSGGDPRGATANYIIVAVRTDAPTPAHQSSFGAVKARYR